MDQSKRLDGLEKENARPKRLLADAEPDKRSLGGPPRGTSEPGEDAQVELQVNRSAKG